MDKTIEGHQILLRGNTEAFTPILDAGTEYEIRLTGTIRYMPRCGNIREGICDSFYEADQRYGMFTRPLQQKNVSYSSDAPGLSLDHREFTYYQRESTTLVRRRVGGIEERSVTGSCLPCVEDNENHTYIFIWLGQGKKLSLSFRLPLLGDPIDGFLKAYVRENPAFLERQKEAEEAERRRKEEQLKQSRREEAERQIRHAEAKAKEAEAKAREREAERERAELEVESVRLRIQR